MRYPTYAEDQARIARFIEQRNTKHVMDAAVQLYRAEKEKRASKAAPALAEARAELDRQKVLAKEQRRGGRPRGRKTGKPDNVFTVSQRQTFHSPIVARDPKDALWQSLGHFEGR